MIFYQRMYDFFSSIFLKGIRVRDYSNKINFSGGIPHMLAVRDSIKTSISR